jgi:hypothetical protein
MFVDYCNVGKEAPTQMDPCQKVTPKPTTRWSSDFSPPPAPKAESRITPLMQALRANSIKLTREALLADPDAASLPFWDHKTEPPICFAVRNRCSSTIIRLLLEYGADAECRDIHGQSPANILTALRSTESVPICSADMSEVERMLNVSSAKMQLPKSVPIKNGGEDCFEWTNSMYRDPLFVAGAACPKDSDYLLFAGPPPKPAMDNIAKLMNLYGVNGSEEQNCRRL